MIYLGIAVLVSLGFMVVMDHYPEQEKQIRGEVRRTLTEAFPRQAEEVAASFGLTRYEVAPDEKPDAVSGVAGEGPAVALIHGLDDPGKVWMNLAPALVEEGYDVWRMRYPNDQPIVDSARLFAAELGRLQSRGIGRIAIVAHSMGGLLTREMLTSPEIGYGRQVATGAAPRITRLIMVGTPNHGSELARFRVLGEFREQWVHLLEGRGHPFNGVFDGAGEAKIDLLPESEFLTRLNRRPHPQGVEMHVIAGVMIATEEAGSVSRIGLDGGDPPAEQGNEAATLASFLQSLRNGLGDGLVTVESTRLAGIEHRTVPGTHLSMIRNVTRGSDRVPPAVPVILELLDAGGGMSTEPPAGG